MISFKTTTKPLIIDLYPNIYRLIFFKLGMMMGTTKLYSLILSVNDLDLLLELQFPEKTEMSALIFSQISNQFGFTDLYQTWSDNRHG